MTTIPLPTDNRWRNLLDTLEKMRAETERLDADLASDIGVARLEGYYHSFHKNPGYVDQAVALKAEVETNQPLRDRIVAELGGALTEAHLNPMAIGILGGVRGIRDEIVMLLDAVDVYSFDGNKDMTKATFNTTQTADLKADVEAALAVIPKYAS